MYASETNFKTRNRRQKNMLSGFHTMPLIAPGLLGFLARAVTRELAIAVGLRRTAALLPPFELARFSLTYFVFSGYSPVTRVETSTV